MFKLFDSYINGSFSDKGKYLVSAGTLIIAVSDLLPRYVDVESYETYVLLSGIIGVLVLTAGGTMMTGSSLGKQTFFASLSVVTRNTFLFILLPSFILTFLLVILGVILDSPAFEIN